jgi:tetratricopeptide (TPR) repeat protein
VAAAVIVFAVIAARARQKTEAARETREASSDPAPITFNHDVAPILYANCVTCHRAGQSAPFSLISLADVRKRAKQIAEVTASRYMPPWLPEHGYGEFIGERRLSDSEINILQQWVQQGAAEGGENLLPPLPSINSEWKLGQPDLVVETPPYTLSAEGKDVYHNFVVAVPIPANRVVLGVEFLPGNSRVAHHSFIQVDATRNSRRRAARQNPPGFDGMELPETALMPGGQLLGWQPGKMPSFTPGLGWLLRTNSDLVLQVHMNPSGKPERVQSKVGFYFTSEMPTNTPFRIKLAALRLDIPAGESNYVAEESYTLPVDVSLMRVGAHAHYLGKDLQACAILPNGEKKWLLWIKNWDFRWQGDYGYINPVNLPRGSQLILRYTYDNSANNPRNPNQPPRRVRYGLQSADEMGELYFQALTRTREDYVTLARDFSEKLFKDSMAFYRFRLEYDPDDAEAHARLGRSLAAMGQYAEAKQHLENALERRPDDSQTHFDLGSLLLREKRLREANQEFQAATRLNPDDAQSLGSMGIIALQTGNFDEARSYFQQTLAIDPDDALAAKYLGLLNSRAAQK